MFFFNSTKDKEISPKNHKLDHKLMKVRFLLLFIPLITGSCRKEKDTISPKGKILAPYEFSFFQLPTTLTIQCEASDETKLESIRLQIIDPNGITIASQQFDPQSTTVSFQRNFILSDPYLPSGDYLIKLTVSDGNNTPSTFRTIRIGETPLSVEKVWITQKENSGSRLAHLSGSVIVPDYLSTRDICQLELSAREQLLLLRSTTGTLEGLEINGTQQRFDLNSGNFRHVHFDRSKSYFWAGEQSLELRKFNRNGSVSETYGLFPNGYLTTVPVSRLVEEEHYLLLMGKSGNSNNHSITVVDLSTMNSLPAQATGMSVIHAGEYNSTSIVLFGNSGTDLQISQLQLPSMAITSLQTVSNSKIFEVVSRDNDLYFMGTTTGVLVSQRSTNALLNLAGGSTVSLDWDPTNDVVYRASGNVLEKFAFPSGNLLSSYPATDSVKQVRILFNR